MTVSGGRPVGRSGSAGRRAVDAAFALVLAAGLGLAGCATANTAPSASSDAQTSGPGATLAPIPAVPGAPDHPTGPTEHATLVRVVDGDTIRALVGGREERVRYIGMDTPEPHPASAATAEPYALAATDANARLLAGGNLVLEKDVSERDRYGRLLRDVWIERDGHWTLVNLQLVTEGYAQVSTYPPDVKYVDALLAALRAAREAGRGLWAGSAP